MRYIGLVLVLLFALSLYGFAVKGVKDVFIVGEVKSEHTMKDYLTP